MTGMGNYRHDSPKGNFNSDYRYPIRRKIVNSFMAAGANGKSTPDIETVPCEECEFRDS